VTRRCRPATPLLSDPGASGTAAVGEHALPNWLDDPIDRARVQRALVIKLRHHGDVLLSSPVFSVLQRAFPGAECDALVYAETAPMLEDHPSIVQVHTIDRNWKRSGLARQFGAERRLISALRARRYDLVVHLTEHPRGAWLTRLLAPRYAVARELPGANWLWRSSFTHYYRLPLATPRHTVECNLDALRRIGLQPSASEKALVLRAGPAASERVAALLSSEGLAPRRFIQLHPGSRWLFKCWPAERTAELVNALARDGWPIVLSGAPDAREQALVKAIVGALDPRARGQVHDLSGKLTLKELAALTAQARLFIGVDSAPMHIASAMGTPVVVLFGPSGEIEWGPWQVPQRVITSKVHPCRPCGIDGCGGGKVSECLTTLPVARVHAAARELLAETEPVSA